MIYNTLKILMKEHRITQTKLAEETNITRPTLLSLIKNENKSIKYDVIEGICKLFNVEMKDFIIFSNLELVIKDFEMFYIDYDFYIESSVLINNKKFVFTHTIKNIDKGINFENKSYQNGNYEVDFTLYLDSENYYNFKENNLEYNLNLLVQLKDDYEKYKQDISFALDNRILEPPKKVLFTYNIKKDPNEFKDFRKIMNEIQSLDDYDKNIIYRYLEKILGD